MKSKMSIYRLTVVVIITATITFLFPFVKGSFSDVDIQSLLKSNSSGFTASLARTLIFALLSSLLSVFGGFCLALLLSKISLYSKLGKQLGFFILPVTLGNVAVVFIFKLLLFNTTFFNNLVLGGPSAQSAFLLFLQFWQFGFLFAYLFWLNIQNTPKQLTDYSNATGLSGFEKIRDIYLPQAKNLFILLLFIGFIFSFYEEVKSQFIFKASQGTNTELINHWLNRNYQSNLLINPEYANQFTFKTGLLVFVLAMLAFALIGGIALFLFRIFSRISVAKSPLSNPSKNSQYFSVLFGVLSLLIIVMPVIVALTKGKYNFGENVSSLVFPFFLTLIAAFASAGLAIILGIASRLVFRKWLNTFNSKSLFYFLIIFLLQIIPPLCIILCGFKWMSWIGYNSDILIYFVWIVGHCLLTLPVLGSFIVSTHFSIRENELDYLSAYKISEFSVVKYSFLKRYKAEYSFTVLFAFTFIWNDAGLNMIHSDRVPSFATNLQMSYIGRAADYSKATVFLLVALALSLGCIFIWKYILNKAIKLDELR